MIYDLWTRVSYCVLCGSGWTMIGRGRGFIRPPDAHLTPFTAYAWWFRSTQPVVIELVAHPRAERRGARHVVRCPANVAWPPCERHCSGGADTVHVPGWMRCHRTVHDACCIVPGPVWGPWPGPCQPCCPGCLPPANLHAAPSALRAGVGAICNPCTCQVGWKISVVQQLPPLKPGGPQDA